MTRRTSIRQAAIDALETALTGVASVEASTAYPVSTVPAVRVSTPTDRPLEVGMRSLELQVRIYLKAGSAALDDLDAMAEDIEPVIFALRNTEVWIVDIGEPEISEEQGQLEDNAAVLTMTFPVMYTPE